VIACDFISIKITQNHLDPFLFDVYFNCSVRLAVDEIEEGKLMSKTVKVNDRAIKKGEYSCAELQKGFREPVMDEWVFYRGCALFHLFEIFFPEYTFSKQYRQVLATRILPFISTAILVVSLEHACRVTKSPDKALTVFLAGYDDIISNDCLE